MSPATAAPGIERANEDAHLLGLIAGNGPEFACEEQARADPQLGCDADWPEEVRQSWKKGWDEGRKHFKERNPSMQTTETAEKPAAPDATAEAAPGPDAPAGEEDAEYAIVEIMGHRRHVGRVLDVERFGARMLRVDVPKPGGFAEGYTSHFYGGSAIFGMTLTDRETAERSNRPRSYDRPALFHAPADDDPGTVEAEEYE